MNEIWKQVTVNSDYEVSNIGNIRSHKYGKTRMLKPFRRGCSKKDEQNRGAYLSVRLLDNGTEHDYAVHRLVAMAFIPNPKCLPQVNHINGIRDDNRVENLEWCDNSYNIWHSYNVLGNKNGVEKEIRQYSKDGVFLHEYESLSKAYEATGVSTGSISEVCKKTGRRKTAGGFIWRYKHDNDLDFEYRTNSPVVQISKYGEKLQTFNSVNSAALEVGVSIGGVSGVCLKRTRGYNYAGGYIWRYVDDFDENEFGYFLNKTFIKMTLNNIFVEEYNGTHELVDKGGFELVKVVMCCRGQRKSTNGFKWCIKEEGLKTRKSKKEKPVIQFDKDMNYIAEYPSATIAAKHTNAQATHIGCCCMQGLHRTAGGYRWAYKEEYEKTI